MAIASRKQNNSEQRYLIHQLEFLALKWVAVYKFHDYLYGAKFTVCADNNQLTYNLTTAKLSAMRHHWLGALSTYNFDVLYISQARTILMQICCPETWQKGRTQRVGKASLRLK